MKTAVIAAAALLLAGCSHGAAAASHTTPGHAAAPRTIQQLAQAACPDGYTVDQQTELYVRESATCTSGVIVRTFNDKTSEQQWQQVASSFGGVITTGDLWAVSGDTQASVDAAVAHLGKP